MDVRAHKLGSNTKDAVLVAIVQNYSCHKLNICSTALDVCLFAYPAPYNIYGMMILLRIARKLLQLPPDLRNEGSQNLSGKVDFECDRS